jgi:hypothetical protein
MRTTAPSKTSATASSKLATTLLIIGDSFFSCHCETIGGEAVKAKQSHGSPYKFLHSAFIEFIDSILFFLE